MAIFEGFVHPALAFGAFLAAVPLLIHLLNRQRHKPMQWAAMRFVIAAYKRTRRRAQIENLLDRIVEAGSPSLVWRQLLSSLSSSAALTRLLPADVADRSLVIACGALAWERRRDDP